MHSLWMVPTQVMSGKCTHQSIIKKDILSLFFSFWFVIIYSTLMCVRSGSFAISLSFSPYLVVLRLPSECIKPYRRNYGETFEHSIPENGSLLEFSHRGAPPEAVPVVLWNRTDPETGNAGRGRLLRGGKVWVAERVTQADQGNYTVRDDNGKVLGRSTLTVRGEQSRNVGFKKLTDYL